MANHLQDAVDSVGEAADLVFAADDSVRSLGVGRNGAGYTFVAIRNVRAPRPLSGGARSRPESFRGIPIKYQLSNSDPTTLVRLPHSGPGSPGVASLVPEQQRHRPLVCGLQIQNFDNDQRDGLIASGEMIVGTLGCFVELSDHSIGVLSNNHVIACSNRGVRGADRIVQAGGPNFHPSDHIATLTEFVDLVPYTGTSPKLNRVDAAVAKLDLTAFQHSGHSHGSSHHQNYLPARSAARPTGVAKARIGDQVHKVGRTTGLSYGEVTQVSVRVKVDYDGIGPCRFEEALIVEGAKGTNFSDHGDSGSVIVRSDDGIAVGLLFAGNDTHTWACSLSVVLADLDCHLAL